MGSDKAQEMANAIIKSINFIKNSAVDISKSVVPVFVHDSVDGDCMGSSVAIAHMFRQFGLNSYIVMPMQLPSNMGFMEIEDYVVFKDRLLNEYENIPLVFAVDCSESSRMGEGGDIFDLCPNKLIIDHHASVKLVGEGYYIDSSASSASELVYKVLKSIISFSKKKLDDIMPPVVANALLTGIVTDTGRFTYSNTMPETLVIAGDLMSLGGTISTICYNLFDMHTIEEFNIVNHVQSQTKFRCDNKLAYSIAYNEDFIKFAAEPDSTRKIVSNLRDIDTVEVAFLFKETNGKLKVNIRSQNYFDCSAFATKYGGGGHVRAAGLTMDCGDKNIDDLVSMIVEDAENILRRNDGI